MPGALQEPFLTALKRSCTTGAVKCGDIRIDSEAIASLAASLPAEDIRQAAPGLRLPIRFPNIQAEVSLIALLHLLDFGSGYDDLLLASSKRDAHETIQFGVLGLCLSGKRVDAVFMKCFNNFDVANYFSFSSHEDAPSPVPGVQISRPGPLAALSQKLREVMNQTGGILEEGGQEDLGGLILEILNDQKASGRPCTAGHLVAELADALPAFSDSGRADGFEVVLHRKAQLLAADLYLRFGLEDPERFGFTDFKELAADSGNVLPAVLTLLGVLQVTGETADTIAAGQNLPPGTQERALRAAAVTAADRIAEAAGGAFTAHQLGFYLMAQHAADPACMKLRHRNRDTIAY